MSTTNILDLNNRIDALEKKHDAGGTAADTTYDNTASGLTADNVQGAIDEMAEEVDNLKAWTDPGTKSASGNPITLTDGSARNAEGLSVTCNPKQNLHGYDHPWAPGAGKNKLPMTVDGIKALNTGGTWTGNVYSYRGVDYTILTDADGNVTGIKTSGQASDYTALFIPATATLTGSYTVTGCLSGGSGSTWNLRIGKGANDTIVATDGGSGATFTAETDIYKARIAIMSGVNASGTWFPMIRLSTVSDATFEPYTNECPITGYTECVVDVKDEEETTQDTATITFGQTVYGGSVDFKTGKVTVTHELDDMGDYEWTYVSDSDIVRGFYAFEPSINITKENPLICSLYKTATATGWVNISDNEIGTNADAHKTQLLVKDSRYTDATTFKTAVTGQTIAYELATPIELTLTPAELELLKGYNYITSNGTTIELTYQPYTLKEDILLTVSQLYGSKISILDGILAGGTTGQVLTKTSNDDYDAAWETLPATRTTTRKTTKEEK